MRTPAPGLHSIPLAQSVSFSLPVWNFGSASSDSGELRRQRWAGLGCADFWRRWVSMATIYSIQTASSGPSNTRRLVPFSSGFAPAFARRTSSPQRSSPSCVQCLPLDLPAPVHFELRMRHLRGLFIWFLSHLWLWWTMWVDASGTSNSCTKGSFLRYARHIFSAIWTKHFLAARRCSFHAF